jgi:DNA-binding protein H-NS
MQSTSKVKTYFELLAERDHLDRELTQARAREAEAVLKDIAEKMWLFEFSPRDVEKAYRKHELLYSTPRAQPDRRTRRFEEERSNESEQGSSTSNK